MTAYGLYLGWIEISAALLALALTRANKLAATSLRHLSIIEQLAHIAVRRVA
jgi:hypothetical protein